VANPRRGADRRRVRCKRSDEGEEGSARVGFRTEREGQRPGAGGEEHRRRVNVISEQSQNKDFDFEKLDPRDSEMHVFSRSVQTETIRAPAYPYNAWNPPPPESLEANLSPPEFKEHFLEMTSKQTELLRVRFLSLINIIVMEPLELEEHDIYMCFYGRDPFGSYYMPGYFGNVRNPYLVEDAAEEPLNGTIGVSLPD